MIGYWDKDSPVQTNFAEVKATAYIKPNQTLLSVGNFGNKDLNTMLSFDWKALGLDPSKVRVEAPYIKDFQEARTFNLNDLIPVKAKQGWLLIIQGK